MFEIILVENPVSKVGFDQHVDVKIDVAQNATIKLRRSIYVAIKLLKNPI